jgi:transposase
MILSRKNGAKIITKQELWIVVNSTGLLSPQTVRGGATKKAAESLIAQLDSLCRERTIKKFDIKTKFKKPKNMLPKERT